MDLGEVQNVQKKVQVGILQDAERGECLCIVISACKHLYIHRCHLCYTAKILKLTPSTYCTVIYLRTFCGVFASRRKKGLCLSFAMSVTSKLDRCLETLPVLELKEGLADAMCKFCQPQIKPGAVTS